MPILIRMDIQLESDQGQLSWKQRLSGLMLNDVFLSLLIGGIIAVFRFQQADDTKEVYFTLLLLSNYALLVTVVNYFLLPKLFYRGRYLLFVLSLLLVLVLAGSLEEGLIERIFYPDGRGQEGITWHSMQHVLQEISPTLILFLFLKLASDRQQQQQHTQNLHREKLGSELKFLKSQINPHVLFNNLNNIYSYAQERSEKTPEMILRLSNIMRYMLYECEGSYVPLKKEIRYLENYIQLQQIQMEDRGEVTFRILGDPAGYRVAPLLLIAFVENCFKHSLQTQVSGISIDITARVSEGIFYFMAENNYAEEAQVEDKVGGIGLQNVRQRLELLYPDQHELDFHRSNGIFWVQLRLNLIGA